MQLKSDQPEAFNTIQTDLLCPAKIFAIHTNCGNHFVLSVQRKWICHCRRLTNGTHRNRINYMRNQTRTNWIEFEYFVVLRRQINYVKLHILHNIVELSGMGFQTFASKIGEQMKLGVRWIHTICVFERIAWSVRVVINCNISFCANSVFYILIFVGRGSNFIGRWINLKQRAKMFVTNRKSEWEFTVLIIDQSKLPSIQYVFWSILRCISN